MGPNMEPCRIPDKKFETHSLCHLFLHLLFCVLKVRLQVTEMKSHPRMKLVPG